MPLLGEMSPARQSPAPLQHSTPPPLAWGFSLSDLPSCISFFGYCLSVCSSRSPQGQPPGPRDAHGFAQISPELVVDWVPSSPGIPESSSHRQSVSAVRSQGPRVTETWGRRTSPRRSQPRFCTLQNGEEGLASLRPRGPAAMLPRPPRWEPRSPCGGCCPSVWRVQDSRSALCSPGGIPLVTGAGVRPAPSPECAQLP